MLLVRHSIACVERLVLCGYIVDCVYDLFSLFVVFLRGLGLVLGAVGCGIL